MGPPCGPKYGWAILDDGRLACAINAQYMNKFKQLGRQGVADADGRWQNWHRQSNAGPMNTGCYPGPTLQTCMNYGKRFPDRTVGPQPSPTPSPSPIPSPTPSPSPSPSPSGCQQTVADTCSGMGTWMCQQCCLNHPGVIQPACPEWSDVVSACASMSDDNSTLMV